MPSGEFLCSHSVIGSVDDDVMRTIGDPWLSDAEYSLLQEKLPSVQAARVRAILLSKPFKTFMEQYQAGQFSVPTNDLGGPRYFGAFAVIEKFARRQKPGVFPHIARMDVAKELWRRVKHPEVINQAGGNTCGPAAFVHAIACADPGAYAKFVTDIYDQGFAVLPGVAGCARALPGGVFGIRPSAEFRQDFVPGGESAADWLALGSLRDSANWWFSYHRDSWESTRGSTSTGEMSEWFKQFGFREIIPEETSVFCADLDNLKRADGYFRRNYRVCLRVCANFLEAKTAAEIAAAKKGGKGDHYVVLASPITFWPHVKFKMFTWGMYTDVPIALTVDEFLNSYYGFVAARR